MLKKENRPPTKQGVFYQLNLNQNNGPFLTKDIMHNNHKSKHLLTQTSSFGIHQSLASTLSQLGKTTENQCNNEAKTQNFNATIQFCDEQLLKSQQISNFLSQQQNNFKHDMETLYEKISTINNQLLETSTPVLKNLMKKVKESNQSDKANYYKIQKELRQIEMEKRTMEHMLLNSRNKIERLEKIFGIQEEPTPKSSMVSTRTNNFFE